LSDSSSPTGEEERRREDGSLLSEIIFMGSGSSSGTPHLRCVMDPDSTCIACKDATANPLSKNWRGNPSLLIRYRRAEGGRGARSSAADPENNVTTVLIDVGKTFKQSAVKWFHKYAVANVDGVVSCSPIVAITDCI